MNLFALPGPILHRRDDALGMAREVAQVVATHLKAGLDERPRATLVVSGGRTPVPMWQSLSQAPLDWARVNITLADERWVPPDHPASNEGLVRMHLLQGLAAHARWVPLYGGEASPQSGLPLAEDRLASVAWPADVVVLGMGADGHTASWFPGQALPEDARRCMAVDAPQPPNVAEPRLSLTPAALLQARCLLVHLTGSDKELPLAQALRPIPAEHAESMALAWPIRRVMWAPARACQVYFSA